MGYAIGIFLLQLVNIILFNIFYQICATNGLALRAALSASIYRKSMRLSSLARQNFSPGKITNMISSDAQRIEMFVTLVHTIWSAPLQVIVISIFLILQLSYGAAIGIGLLIILTPLQALLWKMLSNIRKKNALLSDARIKTTQEVLQGIRVIKFFTWENPFLEKIFDLRQKEISYVFRKG